MTKIAEAVTHAALLNLIHAAQQADAYIRETVDTGHEVNMNAVPLLRLREAIQKAEGRT